MVVIRVSNVSFDYRVIRTTSNSLKGLLRDILRGSVKITNYAALQNVSFDVSEGEVLAILGKNGAGKSTLLKVLAKVLPPTAGLARIEGKIAPMIELGAGFHAELTGAENVIFYSTLLGRDIKKTREKVADIGEWAGVTDHMNFPLRTFSSGMVARLAFATATAETADVLLVDEILSVGDASFREKSRSRMLELIDGGAAVILVSHDMSAVRSLATRAIWLEAGKVKMSGYPEEVVSAYEKSFL